MSHTKDSDVSIQKALSRNLIPDKQALMQRIHPVVELDFITWLVVHPMQKFQRDPQHLFWAEHFTIYDNGIPKLLRQEHLVDAASWDPLVPFHHPMQVTCTRPKGRYLEHTLSWMNG